MTIEQLIEKLQQIERNVGPDVPVKFRNHAVSDAALEAGSDGYLEVDEVLAAGEAGVFLLSSEEVWT